MSKTLTLYHKLFETPRLEPRYEPPKERLKHFDEFYVSQNPDIYEKQAGRCMSCGVPFCHNAGCPLGNPIPETNALVAEGRWKDACELLHLYNNFPEFTGRLCPALCEAACVHSLHDEGTSVRQIEQEIVRRGWEEGWITPRPSSIRTGKKIAVVGSGPAGLAAAQQLARSGHEVVVYERDPFPGGILRYGIPDFKIEKPVLDQRIYQLIEEGVRFETNVVVGEDVSPLYLKKRYDAILLAGGAMEPRDLEVPERNCRGIHFAMEYLTASNRAVASNRKSTIDAAGLNVVILGGGDTGADCLGVALRQGAKSVTQLEIMPKPPEDCNPETPWPLWPRILRTGTSHKEGGTRRWSVSTKRFLSENGKLIGMEAVEVNWASGRPEEKPNTTFQLDADLAILALGFTRPKHDSLLRLLSVGLDSRGNVAVDQETMMTDQPGIFVAGDMQSGASLVVRAIHGGRLAAKGLNRYLSDRDTNEK